MTGVKHNLRKEHIIANLIQIPIKFGFLSLKIDYNIW